MRWLFLFVLLVNIAYVSWEYTRPAEQVPVRLQARDVPTILLLSEIEQAVSATGPAAGEKQAQSVMSGDNVSEPAELQLAQVEQAPAVSETPARVEQEAPAASDPPARTPTGVSSSTQECYTLGPFRKLEKLRVYTRAIKDYVVEASFRSRDEREQSMFWVYISPRADIDKAKATGKRLEAMNIKDYYVIHKGDQKNGISLGHFKEKDRAYSHADKIKKLGFQPTIEPVYRSYTIYWLDYRLKPGEVIPDYVFDKHLGNNVKRLDRPCS